MSKIIYFSQGTGDVLRILNVGASIEPLTVTTRGIDVGFTTIDRITGITLSNTTDLTLEAGSDLSVSTGTNILIGGVTLDDYIPTAVGTIGTSELEDFSVTSSKLGTSSVITSKIGTSQVTNSKLASGIDAGKITVGILSNTRLSGVLFTASDSYVEDDTILGLGTDQDIKMLWDETIDRFEIKIRNTSGSEERVMSVTNSAVLNTGTQFFADDALRLEVNTNDVTVSNVPFISPSISFDSGSTNLAFKCVSSAWNMDTVGSISVPHGLTLGNIRSVTANIENNGGTAQYPIPGKSVDELNLPTNGVPDVYIESIDGTNVNIERLTGGDWDSPTYNAATVYVTIIYEVV